MSDAESTEGRAQFESYKGCTIRYTFSQASAVYTARVSFEHPFDSMHGFEFSGRNLIDVLAQARDLIDATDMLSDSKLPRA